MQMPSIAAVYPNRIHYLQDLREHPRDLVYENYDLLERRQQGSTGQNTSSVIYPAEGTPLINPHMLTGVDKLQSEGITGQGIKIAIIDSGIDPSHPALGAGYGPGFKVEGGFDFVGEDGTADDSPITTCSNHGTATSSIAAGMPCKFIPPGNSWLFVLGYDYKAVTEHFCRQVWVRGRGARCYNSPLQSVSLCRIGDNGCWSQCIIEGT